nr:MAG TPA: hypothetical protein [Caudoviricetes sp.]
MTCRCACTREGAGFFVFYGDVITPSRAALFLWEHNRAHVRPDL